MGTNFYLRPRGFDRLEEVTSEVYKDIDYARMEYIKALNKIVDEAKKISPIYKKLLHLPDLDELNEINVNLEYEYELPEVHVCKLSCGWIPLFEATEYYSKFSDFENFYHANTDIFELYDEYNEKIDFNDFKERVLEKVKKGEETHLQFNNTLCADGEHRYWRDDLGIEWTNGRSWS